VGRGVYPEVFVGIYKYFISIYTEFLNFTSNPVSPMD